MSKRGVPDETPDIYTAFRLGIQDVNAKKGRADLKNASDGQWQPLPLEGDDFEYEEELIGQDIERMTLNEQESDEEMDEMADMLGDSLSIKNTDFLSQRFLHPLNKYDPSAYERPKGPLQVDANGTLTFQHTETTYGIVNKELEIRLWGITQEGQSVLVRVMNFLPYFIVDVANEHEASQLRNNLENYLRIKYNGKKKPNSDNYVEQFVVNMEQVVGRSFCGYHMNLPPRPMYKFYMARPSFIAAARDCFEYVNRAVCTRKYDTYEGNVEYELRYMVDTQVNGCEWLRLANAPLVEANDSIMDIDGTVLNSKISTVNYEFIVSHSMNCIKSIPSAEKGDLAPLRFLSYDIEVLRKKRGFPTALEDPCIMIAAALQVVGKGIVHKAVFVLKSKIYGDDGVRGHNGSTGSFNLLPDPDIAVYMYTHEAHMIMGFQQYMKACDPEALTGWNTTNFDMPYLTGRAKALGIMNDWLAFSRIKSKPAWLRQKTFQSKAYGAKTSTELVCEGRFDHDGLTYQLRGVMEKYRSYKLNYIAKKVLNDQKVDVDYSQIPILYEGTDEDRTRLAWYCLVDALLPLQLLEKLMAVVNGIEQSRVTGVPQKWLLEKGQGKKTQSNILRYKPANEFVPSRSAKSNTEVTGGGYVKEPKRGFYKVPLASLDFASLYPSIMIAFNICFSTKVSLHWARENLKPEDYWIPPPAIDKKTLEQLQEEEEQRQAEIKAGVTRKKKNKKDREREEYEQQFAGQEPNFCFVKRHIKQGTLPRLLETLLETRRNVKAMMKNVNPKTDPIYYSVLDGRQLALKVVCNSVYGFLKAFILTDKDLMSAVTSYGRNMIYKVNDVIKTEFNNNDVVDCPACRRMGIDPEIEPKEGEPDLRPRTRTKAFAVYGVSC